MRIPSTGGVSGAALPAPPPARREPMQAAAKTLHLTDDELKSALGSGASLSDLAEQQGVKKDDLVGAMVETLKSTRTQLPDDATGLAKKLVDRKGFGGPPRHASSSTTGGRLVDRYA